MNGMNVSTIGSPEFLNIETVSPLISKCEVKVMYVGANRNKSYITKEVAAEMAKTLPGCPIVGYYIDSKEDFGDHGKQVVIDAEGVKFNQLTKPYGFVAPDSKIQFQVFQEQDEKGDLVQREYLMAEGYLQTEQYKECKRVVDQGNPQSMELDEKTLKGHWATDVNKGVEFFIIDSAIFSKLCILGEDIEPCFEEASVTAPQVSSHFSKDDAFVTTLFSMMSELKELTYSLKSKEGGNSMDELKTVETEAVVEEQAVAEDVSAPAENFSETQDNLNSEITAENDNNLEEFKKNDDDDDDEKDDKKEDEAEDNKENKNDDEEDEDDKKKYSLIATELEELKSQYAKLESECTELRQFKAAVEDEQKTALINSFYMLSDEDKSDVIENKAKYSLDEIEAKLSVICVRKKVNFNLEEPAESEEPKEEAPMIFNLHSATPEDSLPAWLKAVEKNRNN